MASRAGAAGCRVGEAGVMGQGAGGGGCFGGGAAGGIGPGLIRRELLHAYSGRTRGAARHPTKTAPDTPGSSS